MRTKVSYFIFRLYDVTRLRVSRLEWVGGPKFTGCYDVILVILLPFSEEQSTRFLIVITLLFASTDISSMLIILLNYFYTINNADRLP